MTAAFNSHRAAALALLNSDHANLNRKSAGFLGQVTVDEELSVKQREWLVTLLQRNGLPPLAGEVSRG
jgi:hypothetical protein